MTDPLEPLKPLTPKQQDEFDVRRETMSAVQNKCPDCGAWWETAKRSTPWLEVFKCDCGRPMSFLVPALDLGPTMVNEIDGDERLESGMRVRDAIASACYWWNKTGRHMMRKDGAKGHEFAASLNPENPNYIPSGIINGEPWDVLDNRERLMITKAWHHFFISLNQKEG